MNQQVTHPFPIGTKVRVDGFPPAARQSVPFNFNGLIGEVKMIERIGRGLNDQPVYQYLVHFSDVDIPYSHLNPETKKLDKGIKKGEAENFFDQDYLELA